MSTYRVKCFDFNSGKPVDVIESDINAFLADFPQGRYLGVDTNMFICNGVLVVFVKLTFLRGTHRSSNIHIPNNAFFKPPDPGEGNGV